MAHHPGYTRERERIRRETERLEDRNREDAMRRRAEMERQRARDDEERRHRERMALERKRDRAEALRNQGFSEKEIVSFERRRSFKRFLAKLLIVVVLVITAGIFVIQARETSSTNPTRNESMSESNSQDASPQASSPSALNETDGPSRTANQRLERVDDGSDLASQTDEQAEAPSSVYGPSLLEYDGPNRSEIRDDIRAALETGDATLWNVADEQGYVLVSDGQSYGERFCRQLSFTRFEGDAQTSTTPELWCEENGSWSLANN